MKSEILYVKPGKYEGNLRIQFTLNENITKDEIKQLQKRDDVYLIEKYGEQIYVFLDYTEDDMKHDEILKQEPFTKAKRHLVSYVIRYVEPEIFIEAGLDTPFLKGK